MQGCWALMLRYSTRLELPFDAAFINQGPLCWAARENSKEGRGGTDTWVLHGCADWSERHLDQEAEGVAATLIHAFGQFGARAPHDWTLHRWRYASTEKPLENGFVWDAQTNIGLCGDCLNGGTVEGAWLSGKLLAQQMRVTTVMGASAYQDGYR